MVSSIPLTGSEWIVQVLSTNTASLNSGAPRMNLKSKTLLIQSTEPGAVATAFNESNE